jgi:hypothetical protein
MAARHASALEGIVQIAKPILLITTPVGVGWALLEAWRFHWWLAVLMAVLVGIIGSFTSSLSNASARNGRARRHEVGESLRYLPSHCVNSR